MSAFVITISAYGGGGKTTVAKALGKYLNAEHVFHFDDFENRIVFPKSWPHADTNEYDLGVLVDTVQDAKQRDSGYIVCDYPFGRTHTEMAQLIDYTVFIEAPLDIAMARRITRDIGIKKWMSYHEF